MKISKYIFIAGLLALAHASFANDQIIVGKANKDGVSTPIIAKSVDDGASWSLVDNITQPSGIRVEDPTLRLNCNLTNTCFAATLEKYASSKHPIFYSTFDGGKSWSTITNIPGSEHAPGPSTYLDRFICDGKFCLASYVTGKGWGQNSPSFASTQDGGEHWSFITKDDPSLSKLLNSPALSCADQFCVSIGNASVNNSFRASFLVSDDQAKTWNPVTTIENMPSDMYFYINDVNCLQDTTCVAVGYNIIDREKEYGIVIKKEANSKTWTMLSKLPIPQGVEGELVSISSIGNTFVILGRSGARNQALEPIFLISNDKGGTWKLVARISGLTDDKEFHPTLVKCFEESCIAAGFFSGNMSGLKMMSALLFSNDRGESWRLTKISHLPPSEEIYLGDSISDIACNKNICTAVGGFSEFRAPVGSFPMIFTSKDHGASWKGARIKNMPENMYVENVDSVSFVK